tara:strand:- start:1400 stop:1771 length:372 start_codon:yes stop_codon:yes gene_type:complete
MNLRFKRNPNVNHNITNNDIKNFTSFITQENGIKFYDQKYLIKFNGNGRAYDSRELSHWLKHQMQSTGKMYLPYSRMNVTPLMFVKTHIASLSNNKDKKKMLEILRNGGDETLLKLTLLFLSS